MREPGSQANRLLGYPPEARLLIINADDFGMCHSVNAAVIQALGRGVLCSTTLMVPCPWAMHAMHFLSEHPEISFGVHLTVISEWTGYRWGPLTAGEKVPSLVDESGYFHDFDAIHRSLTQVRLSELEVEFRAQIERVLAAGLKPTHLDWHALRIGGRDDVADLLVRLAKEYRLALRVMGRGRIQELQSQGLPTSDFDFLDSYGLESLGKPARYIQMLRDLPAGLSEWALHPALDSAELLAIEPHGRHIRQTDLDFLVSQDAREIIEEEGIVLLDYRPLQEVWMQA